MALSWGRGGGRIAGSCRLLPPHPPPSSAPHPPPSVRRRPRPPSPQSAAPVRPAPSASVQGPPSMRARAHARKGVPARAHARKGVPARAQGPPVRAQGPHKAPSTRAAGDNSSYCSYHCAPVSRRYRRRPPSATTPFRHRPRQQRSAAAAAAAAGESACPGGRLVLSGWVPALHSGNRACSHACHYHHVFLSLPPAPGPTGPQHRHRAHQGPLRQLAG